MKKQYQFILKMSVVDRIKHPQLKITTKVYFGVFKNILQNINANNPLADQSVCEYYQRYNRYYIKYISLDFISSQHKINTLTSSLKSLKHEYI